MAAAGEAGSTSGGSNPDEGGRAEAVRAPGVLARKSRETAVERTKRASRHLRGGLREALRDTDSGLSDLDQRVAKFHGIYQQEDRDAKAIARLTGAPRTAQFMVRTRLPAGRLTATQYLAIDRLADDVVHDGSLRITTRQNFQLHGIAKGALAHAIRRINEAGVSTLCGCGDVERNVVAPPAPLAHAGYRELHALADEIAEAMAPATGAYREVWLDGEGVDAAAELESEPLYGETYLPRKFKTGLALPGDDSAGVHSQDVGLIGIYEDGALLGANVLVGGGAGLTHRKAETYARMATPLGFVARAHLTDVVRTIASIYRDFGDRTDRRHARLKYVVEEWGIDVFRAEFERRADFALEPWVETGPLRHRDWLGPHDQGHGRWLYGIHLENGRIIDDARRRWKTVLRTLAEMLRPSVVLTADQNLLLADLEHEDLAKVEAVLSAYGLPLPAGMSPVRRHAMACPALPTCGLALTESERVAPDLVAAFERTVGRAGARRRAAGRPYDGLPERVRTAVRRGHRSRRSQARTLRPVRGWGARARPPRRALSGERPPGRRRGSAPATARGLEAAPRARRRSRGLLRSLHSHRRAP